VSVDDRAPYELDLSSSTLEFGVPAPIARGLADREHGVQIMALGEGTALDGFIVEVGLLTLFEERR
jgi:hypothetical protein